VGVCSENGKITLKRGFEFYPLTSELNFSRQRCLARFLLGILFLKPCISLIYALKTNKFKSQIATHHVTRHNTLIHNILYTAPLLIISQKALGTLSEDGNVMPKLVEATIHI
jgi:hypothetical protein